MLVCSIGERISDGLSVYESTIVERNIHIQTEIGVLIVASGQKSIQTDFNGFYIIYLSEQNTMHFN